MSRVEVLQVLAGAHSSSNAISGILEDAKRELARPPRFDLRPGAEMLDAVRCIDTAEFRLLRSAPPGGVLDPSTRIAHLAQSYLPENDSRRIDLERIIERGVPASSDELRSAAEAAAMAVNEQRLRSMGRAYRTSTILTVVVLAAGLFAVLLPLLGLLRGGALSLCYEGVKGSSCPLGTVPHPLDVTVVESAGIAGAVASSVLSLRVLWRAGMPRRTLPLVVALKLACGALAAFGALRLIAAGMVPGLSALGSQKQIFLWAAFAGAAQQVITVHLDRRLLNRFRRAKLWSESIIRPRSAQDDVHSISYSSVRVSEKQNGISRGKFRFARHVEIPGLVGINMFSVAIFGLSFGGLPIEIITTVIAGTLFAGSAGLLVRSAMTRRRTHRAGARDEWRAGVRASLEELGYSVTSAPCVGLPDVDSLLQSVDLVAEHPNRTLAVQIHRARPGRLSTDWRAASELLLATGALGGLARDNKVEPLMVLVDSTADNSLQRLAEDRSIKLVEVKRGSGALLTELRGQLGFLRAAGTGAGLPGS
jgi:hypothetical protein